MMYEALLLSATDVAALRATLIDPRFSALAALVPGLSVALQQPQPEFNLGRLYEVYDAIREVRANTNYPEDWDDLSDHVDDGLKRRRVFDEAQALAATLPAPAEASPVRHFVIVSERIGCNDGPDFGEHVYTDFRSACAALDAYVENSYPAADFDDDDGVSLKPYLRPEHQSYWIHLQASHGEVRHTFSLQKFTPAPGGVIAATGAPTPSISQEAGDAA